MWRGQGMNQRSGGPRPALLAGHQTLSLDFLIRKMGINVPTLRCLGEVFVNCHMSQNTRACSSLRLYRRYQVMRAPPAALACWQEPGKLPRNTVAIICSPTQLFKRKPLSGCMGGWFVINQGVCFYKQNPKI